jgi:transposase
MITEKAKRQKEIFELFIDVENSSLSVENYFTTHQTPVSRAQYYLLKKRYNQIGLEALDDQRQAGNARKVKPEQEELVSGILTYNRHLTSKSLKDELQSKWGIELSQSRIDQLRQKYNLRRIQPDIVEKEIVQFAGIEIFVPVRSSCLPLCDKLKRDIPFVEPLSMFLISPQGCQNRQTD